MQDPQFEALEKKIDDLIRLCSELNSENVNLKADAHNWAAERESLVSRNEVARDKVEAILSRLKGVEHSK